MTHASVTIQLAPDSVPTTPCWFAEVAAFAQVLTHVGVLKAIRERVRFTRARFGHYDLIDFVVVLIGYALSGEPTLKAFYERLLPFAEPFMALFGRHLLPHRSTLSRFLAALDQPCVEALRTLFQEDLVVRNPFASPGGMLDRRGKPWIVVDVDGTRAAARQRALPQIEALPAPHRRFDQVCAPGSSSTQERRSRANPDDSPSGSYPPIPGNFRWARQRRLQGGVVACHPGDHQLCAAFLRFPPLPCCFVWMGFTAMPLH